MSPPGARVTVVGATGALGGEVLTALAELAFPVSTLRAFASEASAAAEVQCLDATTRVEAGPPDVSQTDLLFLCCPPSVALEWVAAALRRTVPVFDLSGALAGRTEVPLGIGGWVSAADIIAAPAVATPAGVALGWLRALLPLHRAIGIERIVGASLESVSGRGRAGVETLGGEAVALFNQTDTPASEVFAQPVAFSCVPEIGTGVDRGSTSQEENLGGVLSRVLGDRVEVSVTCVQVPTFAGDGAVVHCDLREAAPLEKLRAAWLEAPGVEFDPDFPAPATRSVAGTATVRVGRVRRGASADRSVALWLAVDPLRLAAHNAVELALARVRLH